MKRDEKIRLGISACLLGEEVRYDGGHKCDRWLTDILGRHVDYVPVCPEHECGLPTPRESMRLAGNPDAPRLVTTRSGVDHTEQMIRFSRRKVSELEDEDLSGFIFKAKSPSCGIRQIPIVDPDGNHCLEGSGIFAGCFMERLPDQPVEDDERLRDPSVREGFLEQIFEDVPIDLKLLYHV